MRYTAGAEYSLPELNSHNEAIIARHSLREEELLPERVDIKDLVFDDDAMGDTMLSIPNAEWYVSTYSD